MGKHRAPLTTSDQGCSLRVIHVRIGIWSPCVIRLLPRVSWTVRRLSCGPMEVELTQPILAQSPDFVDCL